MNATTPKAFSKFVSLLVTLAGAAVGTVFIPLFSPNLTRDMGSASLMLGLHLTGHLQAATILPQAHVVAAVVSGLLALALWELYCCILPRQKERATQTILFLIRNPGTWVGLFFLTVLFLCISTLGTFIPAPADTALIANFHQNRRAFEQLRQMLRINPSLQSATAEASNGMPLVNSHYAVIAKYGTQLNDASITRVEIPSPDGHSLRFEMHAALGDAESYEEKGYLYSESPPTPLVASLDDAESVNSYTYRHLDGNWYLYYEYRAM